MSEDFERLVQEFERFEQKIRSFEDRAADVTRMSSEVDALEATARSADGSVTVVAGPAGAIKDIRITEDALRQGARTLAGTVLSTVHQAVAEAARQQAMIIERHAGADLHLVDQVLEAQAQAFGMPVEQLREKVDVASRAAPENQDGQGSVLRGASPPPSAAAPPPANSAGDDFLRNLGGEEG